MQIVEDQHERTVAGQRGEVAASRLRHASHQRLALITSKHLPALVALHGKHGFQEREVVSGELPPVALSTQEAADLLGRIVVAGPDREADDLPPREVADGARVGERFAAQPGWRGIGSTNFTKRTKILRIFLNGLGA